MSKEIGSLFVPYDLSIQLKELSFNKSCFGFYGDDKKLYFDNPIINYEDGIDPKYVLAPLYTQAFKWFRDKFHIHGEPFYKGGLTKKTSWYDYQIYSDIDFKEDKIQYKTYEEAELECLKKLISIVKDKL